jgi:lipid A 3-O-deacylase
MKNSVFALSVLLLLAAATLPAPAQITGPHPAGGNDAPASAALATDPWEYGAFFQGGFGVGDRSDFSFTNAGVRLGKVLTSPHLGSIFRGQFEYAGEILPYWQAFTPAAGNRPTPVSINGDDVTLEEPFSGGTFNGISITPIILRWDLKPHKRLAPYIQGAGGLIWTNHKFPPDLDVPAGDPGRTSVWNFTPQFGIGAHYFIKNRQAIDLQASAFHISSASLGDRNPGVNAGVEFQIGWSWWK